MTSNEVNEELNTDISSSSFDAILNKKIAEINELYELKTRNKK
jgi:hypothetical protein